MTLERLKDRFNLQTHTVRIGMTDPIEVEVTYLALCGLAGAGLVKGLEVAATRLQILTDRMRGCHEETGKHELLDEAQAFADEAKAALAKFTAIVTGGSE